MRRIHHFDSFVTTLWSQNVSLDFALTVLRHYGYSRVQCEAKVREIYAREERVFKEWCKNSSDNALADVPDYQPYARVPEPLTAPLRDGDKNWDHPCDNCDGLPTVHPLGLCGPCTWGEADTYGGNW